MHRILVVLLALFAVMAAAGTAVAAVDLPAEQLWQRADALMKQRRYQQAIPILAEASERGHPRATTALANIYARGEPGIPVDMHKAMRLYERGVQQGHRFAEYSLGNGYMLGLGGLPVDQEKASALFEAAARKGLVDAQEAIAMSYELGRGVPKDRGRAVAWARAAASQGDFFSGAFAKILANPHTPVFANNDDMFGYFVGVFQYCWRGRFPRWVGPDPVNPNMEIWAVVPPNWRDSYCN